MSDNPKPKAGLHKATYARDKRKGGYLIRVAGPFCERFSGRDVPVTTMAGEVKQETLDRLIWTGMDTEIPGMKVALYSFEKKPREDLDDEISF